MTGFRLIDKLVAKSFIGPYILFFFIVEFVLIMQFLWKYIDEILGKGFSVFELLQMIFYYGITIIPMAIPLTILISSVMVYGEMSEKYELVSMKSAGLSLFRILRAGIIIAIFTAAFSLFASNYLKPIANFKFQSTFISLRKKKPTLSIEEGIFNKDFNGYTIQVKRKHKDNISIEDVLVYDHSNAHKGEINVISAKNGKMYTTADGNYFIMKLFNGEHVKEIIKKNTSEKNKSKPLMRTHFEEWTKVFDMSKFNSAGSININRNKHDLLNSKQILVAIDSLDLRIAKNNEKLLYEFGKPIDPNVLKERREREKRKILNSTTNDKGNKQSKAELSKSKKTALAERNRINNNQNSRSIKNRGLNRKSLGEFKNKVKAIKNKSKSSKRKKAKKFKLLQSDTLLISSTFRETIDSSQLKILTTSANAKARTLRDRLSRNFNINKKLTISKNKFLLRLYQQYSWAIICIVFLFIGAPLGSIIKKGGFGFPVLMAIAFFIAFILLLITGEKLLKSESVGPLIAAWLPVMVLSPVAVLVTILALKDLKMSDILSGLIKKEVSDPVENLRKLEADGDFDTSVV